MLNISVRQLHYFMALVKAGSFSRAAEVVGVTQSTLSAAIQSLEAELGVTLIDRSGRRMQLLPAGEDFLERARTIVALIEELPEHARQAERPLTTRLRMGVIPSIAPFLLPKILPATSRAFPELQLTIREGLTRPCWTACVQDPSMLRSSPIHTISMNLKYQSLVTISSIWRCGAIMPWPIATGSMLTICRISPFSCWKQGIVFANTSWPP